MQVDSRRFPWNWATTDSEKLSSSRQKAETCDEKKETFLLAFLSLGVAFGWRRKKWKRASGFNLLIAALKISSSSLGGGKQIKTIHTLIIQNRIPICLRSIELQANGTQRAWKKQRNQVAGWPDALSKRSSHKLTRFMETRVAKHCVFRCRPGSSSGFYLSGANCK